MKLIHKDADGRHVWQIEPGDKGVSNWGTPENWYELTFAEKPVNGAHMPFNFQNGSPRDNGGVCNGWTLEGVLAMSMNRLTAVDKKMPCIENKQALMHMQAAFDLLSARSQGRRDRGVDGTMAP